MALHTPDVDNNCQVQIVIYDIDGAYNTGGYFASSLPPEAVFVDFADITLSWGRSILAHELEHLLHNARPLRNLWIDEGNADVAIYLCFGADSTLTGHVNAWTGAPTSVRWWNQRIADYGAGYMFTCISPNTSAADLLFVNSSKTPPRVDGALRTSPFSTSGKSVSRKNHG